MNKPGKDCSSKLEGRHRATSPQGHVGRRPIPSERDPVYILFTGHEHCVPATITLTVNEATMTERAIEPQLSPNYVIDVSKPVHVSWWAAALGVTEQELAEAVSAIGVRATEVCRYLRKDRVTRVEGCPPRRVRNRPGAQQRSRGPARRATFAAVANRQISR